MTRITRKNFPQHLRDTSRWIEPTLSADNSAATKRFWERRAVLEAYLQRMPIREAMKKSGYGWEQIYRDLSRCVAMADDGAIWGWRALADGTIRKAYQRRSEERRDSSTGKSGLMQQYFMKHPDIEEALRDYVLGAKRNGVRIDKLVTPSGTHRLFLKLADEIDPLHQSWPFTTAKLARVSIEKFHGKLLDENYSDTVLRQHGHTAKAKSSTGRGERGILPFTRPYDCVEIDEHDAHFFGVVGIDSPSGLVWVAAERIKIIAVVDRCAHGAILGYAVCVKAVSSDDLLGSIHVCAQVQKPASTFLKVPAGGGFPSELIPVLARCGFASILFDNALSHLAGQVATRIAEVFGSAINYGQFRRFDRRPFVEHAFRELEQSGFRRIPSYTESKATDPRKDNPIGMAVKYRITLSELEELVGCVFAEINGKPTGGAHSKSRLDFLRDFVSDESIGFITPSIPLTAKNAPDLNVKVLSLRVRGSKAKGDRPHLNYEGARYRGTGLADRFDLINTDVVVHVNTADISTIDVFERRGGVLLSLGALNAQQQWYGWSHSLRVRKEICKLTDDGLIASRARESVQDQYLGVLASRAIAESGHRPRGAVSKSAGSIAHEKRTRENGESRRHEQPRSESVGVERDGLVMWWLRDVLSEDEETAPIFKAGE